MIQKFILFFFSTILGLTTFYYFENKIFPNLEIKTDLDYNPLKDGKTFAGSPIGDNIHTELYSFIENALITSKSWSQKDIQLLRENEIKHKDDKDYKPFMAEISEGELASLLKILCKVQPSCSTITIYQKDGIGISSTGYKNIPIYSVLMTPRKIDFEIGILSPDTMNEPKVYISKTHDSQIYYEYLKAIFHHKDKDHEYSYVDFLKRNSDDTLIGYVSYAVIGEDKDSIRPFTKSKS